MKSFPVIGMAIGLTAVALLSGCDTFSNRAEQKATVFNSLDANTQDRLHKGMIAVGDTKDMVYIALGIPDRKKERVTEHGRETTWIYSTYYQDYVGSDLIGYHRYFSPFGGPGRYAVYWQPIGPDLYPERSEENMRVTFVDGKGTVVEQMQN